MSQYQTVLLFGPPGAGKGTQGRILGTIPGFFHCACGDVFRQLDIQSDIGRLFLDYSSKGELVPDEITIEIWARHIDNQVVLRAFKPEFDVLVLDGIPRTVEQADLLTKHIHVLKVLHLVCPDEEQMIERLRRRALRENRMDDAKESVIRHRWEIYQQETAPLLDYYGAGHIADIDAQRSPGEVLQQSLEILIPVQNSHFARLSFERAVD
ncbi:Adenylate kinase [Planctomycetes bacterium Pan216]|uniref:Adenylate kinase n=1 Tax=Kolteria novifilia TaxID=2527975 RepID=A0A518B5K0_9BACT|nr:Adenylate kinase [Planctomycetes bacterium Pan216]